MGRNSQLIEKRYMEAIGGKRPPRMERKAIRLRVVTEQAAVLCVDEKSQIQALDRTQHILPKDRLQRVAIAILACLTISSSAMGQCPPAPGRPDYLVGPDYSSTTAHLNGNFISRYHLPDVRATVMNQLAAMALQGTSVVSLRIFHRLPTSGPPPYVSCADSFASGFPFGAQERANLIQFTTDVGATTNCHGTHLRLLLTSLGLDPRQSAPGRGGKGRVTIDRIALDLSTTPGKVILTTTQPHGIQVDPVGPDDVIRIYGALGCYGSQGGQEAGEITVANAWTYRNRLHENWIYPVEVEGPNTLSLVGIDPTSIDTSGGCPTACCTPTPPFIDLTGKGVYFANGLGPYNECATTWRAKATQTYQDIISDLKNIRTFDVTNTQLVPVLKTYYLAATFGVTEQDDPMRMFGYGPALGFGGDSYWWFMGPWWGVQDQTLPCSPPPGQPAFYKEATDWINANGNGIRPSVYWGIGDDIGCYDEWCCDANGNYLYNQAFGVALHNKAPYKNLLRGLTFLKQHGLYLPERLDIGSYVVKDEALDCSGNLVEVIPKLFDMYEDPALIAPIYAPAPLPDFTFPETYYFLQKPLRMKLYNEFRKAFANRAYFMGATPWTAAHAGGGRNGDWPELVSTTALYEPTTRIAHLKDRNEDGCEYATVDLSGFPGG